MGSMEDGGKKRCNLIEQVLHSVKLSDGETARPEEQSRMEVLFAAY